MNRFVYIRVQGLYTSPLLQGIEETSIHRDNTYESPVETPVGHIVCTVCQKKHRRREGEGQHIKIKSTWLEIWDARGYIHKRHSMQRGDAAGGPVVHNSEFSCTSTIRSFHVCSKIVPTV